MGQDESMRWTWLIEYALVILVLIGALVAGGQFQPEQWWYFHPIFV